ncbi:MAG: hypothetical protein IJY04_10685 [Clostridia bacterium]|nr:hypothetical protein [Clostridia bacterium]
MILNSKETNVAYRCPKCGRMVFSMVGIFSLSGDMIKLKCDCGGSELTAVYTGDRKIRLSVPCFLCPHPHNYVLSPNSFFKGGLFRLACTYSGIDIALIGDKDAVKAAAEEADKEFLQLLKESVVEEFGEFAEAKEADDLIHGEEIADPQMQSVVHFMLCELEDEGNISCKCGRACGKYEFKFVGDRMSSVLIYCEKCAASVTVPLFDTVSAEEFLQIDKLTLT